MGCSLCRNEIEVEIVIKHNEQVEEIGNQNITIESQQPISSPGNSFLSSFHEPQAYYAVNVLTEPKCQDSNFDQMIQDKKIDYSINCNFFLLKWQATYFIINDQVYYTGSWKSGLQHGYGRQIKINEFLYQGNFKEGVYEGYGTLINKNGEIYEGNFSNGKANGQGTLKYANRQKYTGNWKNDKYDGFGREEFPDGSYYEGQYQDGVRHGEGGVYMWKDGSKYTGQFQNNEFEGEGTLKWLDGRSYTGNWVKGKMHGKGVYNWQDGNQYIGEYADGIREGQGQLILKGKKISGIFKNGKLYSILNNDGTLSEFEKISNSAFDFGQVLQKSSGTEDKYSRYNI